jgi:DNA polymerase I-like protein with 3'-5' exonuclease and polymerase domains
MTCLRWYQSHRIESSWRPEARRSSNWRARFNINSPKQLSVILFDKLSWPPANAPARPKRLQPPSIYWRTWR